MLIIPKFYTSEYYVPELDNWNLKEGAPHEIVEEFAEWVQMRAEILEK